MIKKSILLLTLLISCTNYEQNEKGLKEYNPIAISIHDSAMKKYQNYILRLREDEQVLDTVLFELDRAINLDSTNYVFYTNKALVMTLLNRYDDAIKVLEKVAEIRPHFAENLTSLGFLNEKIENDSLAQIWYSRALTAYDTRIKNDQFVINSKINKAYLLFFTKNKEAALRSFYEIKKEYPDSEEVLFMESLFTDFDREETLNTF